jgi:diaminopimelate epimerase
MRRRFHKMHGLGNDFVVIDARDDAFAVSPALARAIADRRSGVGCDQLILIEPSAVADVRMRIFNPDGGEVGACGNAARCVASFLGGALAIETAGGTIHADAGDGGVRVDMGAPRFGWDDVPLAYPLDTAALPLGWDGVAPLRPPMAVNVGNPHVVLFVADAQAVDLAAIGPAIEQDPVFPERVNVGIATIEARDRIRLRVWERGAGATRACGTGACAAAVAAIRAGLADTEVSVRLPGGALRIGWTPGGTIAMTGPASHVFDGEIDTDALAA